MATRINNKPDDNYTSLTTSTRTSVYNCQLTNTQQADRYSQLAHCVTSNKPSEDNYASLNRESRRANDENNELYTELHESADSPIGRSNDNGGDDNNYLQLVGDAAADSESPHNSAWPTTAAATATATVAAAAAASAAAAAAADSDYTEIADDDLLQVTSSLDPDYLQASADYLRARAEEDYRLQQVTSANSDYLAVLPSETDEEVGLVIYYYRQQLS